MIHIIGYIAGSLTTFCFLPQVIKIIREKSVEGVSLFMYVAFTCGVFMWLIYGILINNPPVIIFNSITLLLDIAIIVNIIKYKK